MTTEGVMVWY